MITLRFIDGGGAGSQAIKLFSRGWCSHVDAVLPDGRLLGARHDGGVLIRPADYIKATKQMVVVLNKGYGYENVDPIAFHEFLHGQVGKPLVSNSDGFYAFIAQQLGKPYDMKAVEAFALGRDWRTPDSWFCSELIAAALEAAFFPAKISETVNHITPRDLLLMVSPWASVTFSEGF